MSVLRIMWNLMELLVALRVIAGNNGHYVWEIALLFISIFILKRKNLHFLLFLPIFNILKGNFRTRWHYYSKHRFREILKPLHACFSKESPALLPRCIKCTVNFFTEMVGGSDEQNDESSDEDINPKEESSQPCSESQEGTSDFETEKPSVNTTPEASSTPQKRKAEATELEIEMKRSKFSDALDESTSPLCPESKSEKKLAAADRLHPSFRNFSQGFGGAPVPSTSADMGQSFRQAVKSLEPEKLAFVEFQLPDFPPGRPSSGESSRNELVTSSSAAARTSDLPSPKTRSPEKNSLLTQERSHELLEIQQCVDGDECRDSGEKGENRATYSQDADNKVPVSERDTPRSPSPDVPRGGRLVTRSARGTNTENISHAEVAEDLPDIVTSVTGFRRRKIAEAKKEFFEEFEKKPTDPRISHKNEGGSGGGNTGQAEECSSSLDSTIDPLTLPGPSSGLLAQPFPPEPLSPPRSPPLSPSAINVTDHHNLNRGELQYYREYPGLTLQPFSVKKDATYQKRFYREKKRLVMPAKMGKIIRWGINVSQDLARDVPRHSISDEDKLPLDTYHKLSQELVKGFTKPYVIAREKRMKRRQIRKLNKPHKKANSSESSDQELPSDTSSDESVKSCDSRASRSRTHSGENSEMVLPQSPNENPNQARDSAAVAHTPPTMPAQHLQQSIKVQKLVYSYGDYLSHRFPVQPVQIKFVMETSRTSRRLIFCRDNLSFPRDEHSRIHLKPFFEVEEVLEVYKRCPSVSVEEFLNELLQSQELYYQMLYEGTESFHTLRKHICRCVIPLRRGESDNDDYELDGDTLKPSTSRSKRSSKSLDSSGEASSSPSGISQQQTQSGTEENDDVQQSDAENERQSQKSSHSTAICIPSTSTTGLPSSGKSWESLVSRSETRSSLSRCPRNNNITEWPTLETVSEKNPSVGSAVGTSTNARKPRETLVVAPETSSQKDITTMSLSQQLEISETCENTPMNDQFLTQESFQERFKNLDSHKVQRIIEDEQRAILESLLFSAQSHSTQQEDQSPSDVHNIGNPSFIEHFSVGTSKPETKSPFFDDPGPSTKSMQLPIIIDVRDDVSLKKKHVVWYPPSAEVDQDSGLSTASGKTETHSTSEQQNLPQPELSAESTDSAEECIF